MTFIPVLAAEPSIVFLIVLVISVVSWLVNLVQGSKPKKNAQRPRPANQGSSELELFLQQVVGGKPEAEPSRPAVPKPARPAGEKKSGKNKPQPAKRPSESQRPTGEPRASSDRPGKRLAQTHLASSTVGDGVRSHVTSHLEPRNVDAAVQTDVTSAVRRDIDDTVLRDIGTDGTTAATINRPAAHPLVQALRNPQGVRQAVILSEILNRPRSLR